MSSRGMPISLTETLGNRLRRPPAAIVSSLPLLLKPEIQRIALLADAFQCMTPDGCFIQFTYGPLSPIPRDQASALGVSRRSVAAGLVESAAGTRLDLPAAAGGTPNDVPQRQPNPAQEFLDRLKLGTEKIHLDLKKEIAAAKARLRRRTEPCDQARRRDGRTPRLQSSRGKPSGIDNSRHL